MGYVFLALTVLSETAGTTFMKLSEGFSRPVFGAAAAACYVSTLACMTMALKHLSLSLVYAVWSGAGLVLVTILGMLVFKESLGWQKIACTALILAGVVGLNALRQPAG